MATADSVPGVSGGTIAFILGFYDKFIFSLNNLVSGTKEERIEAIKFLSKIGIGWVVGLVVSILLIASIFEEHIYEISSVFLGLIVVAIPLIIKEEKTTIEGKYINLLFTLTGILVVVLITYFNPVSSSGGTSIHLGSLNVSLMIFIFIAGMIAISAMVLPGISGSTILLIMGLYAPIITGIKEVLGFDFNYVPGVAVFGLGIVAGVFVTIRLVKVALEKYRPQTIYTIIGLMVGSLYAVVNGPQSLEVPKAAMNISTFSILFFVLGGLLIVGLDYLKGYLERKTQ